jgi:hypothetical protein
MDMSKTTVRDSLTTTYHQGMENPGQPGVTQFVFDHHTQQKVTPKAAARAGSFGTRTMNSGGRAAGPVNGKL